MVLSLQEDKGEHWGGKHYHDLGRKPAWLFLSEGVALFVRLLDTEITESAERPWHPRAGLWA